MESVPTKKLGWATLTKIKIKPNDSGRTNNLVPSERQASRRGPWKWGWWREAKWTAQEQHNLFCLLNNSSQVYFLPLTSLVIATVYIHTKLVNFLIYKKHLLKFTRCERKSGLMTSISFLELGCTWLFLGPRICMIITLFWIRLDLSPSWGVYHIFQIIEWIIVVWIILLNLVSAFLRGFWLGCCWSE